MHTSQRVLTLAVAAAAATVAVGCAHVPDKPAPKSLPSPPVAALVSVQLDVTGTGRGNIRFSSDRGVLIAHDVVLHGWNYSYLARSSAPVILEVSQPHPATSSCAAHVSGTLKTSASGNSPSCAVTTT